MSPQHPPQGRQPGPSLSLNPRPRQPLQFSAPAARLLPGRARQCGSARWGGRPGAASPPRCLRGGPGRGPAPRPPPPGPSIKTLGRSARRFEARFQVTLRAPLGLRPLLHVWVVAGLELQPCCSGTRSPSTTTSTTPAAICGKGRAAPPRGHWAGAVRRGRRARHRRTSRPGRGAARSGCPAAPLRPVSPLSALYELRERAAQSPALGRTDRP